MKELPKTMGEVEASPFLALVKEKTGGTDAVAFIKTWRKENGASMIDCYIAHGFCYRCRGRGYTFEPVHDLSIPYQDYPINAEVNAKRCSPCNGHGTPGRIVESRRSR